MTTLFKLVLNFIRMGEARFTEKATLIVTNMTTEPMLTLVADPLPATVPSRATVSGALDDYKAAALIALDGGRSDIADRNGKREILTGYLADWAQFLELAAKNADDITILEKSGYDLRQPKEPVPQPVAAPDLKVFRNGFSGQIHGRAPAVDGGLGYEGQFCIGTDTQEANWRSAFFSNGSTKLKWDGLTPGQVYSFRLRALGRDGWGPWSDIAQLMAT